MGILKKLKFWKKRNAEEDKIRDLEEQLREERQKNYEEQQYILRKWWEANQKLEHMKAKEDKIRNLEEQLQEEKRKNNDEQQYILQKWWEANQKLEHMKAEKEKASEKLNEELQVEKKKNYDEQSGQIMINILGKWWNANHELEQVKAEKEKQAKRFKEELQAERKRNYEEQQKILLKWWNANNELAQLKAKQSAHNSQPAANRNEPQKGDDHNEGTSLNDFTFLRVLGQGGFGKVLLAESKSAGTLQHEEGLYAVKVLKKRDIIKDNSVEFVMAERDILNLVYGHPFCISLFSSFQTETHLFFVMELAHGGDLRSLLQLLQRFSQPVATFYAAEIALAVQFLHKKGIVHRDLKPENVLLDKEGHIKVTDFGLAKQGMFATTRTQSFCGTRDYMAPEMALELQYGHEIDWWALGITIYEMLIGVRPFKPHDDCEVLDSIAYDDIWYPEWLSKEALSILEGFLNKDPAQRLTADQTIRSHQFFKGMRWEELAKKQVQPPIRPQIVKRSKVNGAKKNALITPALPVFNADNELFRGFSFMNCHQ